MCAVFSTSYSVKYELNLAGAEDFYFIECIAKSQLTLSLRLLISLNKPLTRKKNIKYNPHVL